MAGNQVKERTLEETPTWAVAVVCLVLLAVSITIEHIIHAIGKVIKLARSMLLKDTLIIVVKYKIEFLYKKRHPSCVCVI